MPDVRCFFQRRLTEGSRKKIKNRESREIREVAEISFAKNPFVVNILANRARVAFLAGETAATSNMWLPQGEGNGEVGLIRPHEEGGPAADLDNQLRHLVVGQEEAIHQIVKSYHLSGLVPVGRPIGNFLFLGPTGSGKTRIVEATAEALLKNPRAVIKIDCAEFQHSHEIAKLIGSPIRSAPVEARY